MLHAWIAYAVLSSRLALWLWRVEADGFHVTRSFLLGLPMSPTHLSSVGADLSDLAQQLWGSVLSDSSVSTNRGKQSVAFPPRVDDPILDRIDRVLADFYGLPAKPDLKIWHNRLVQVNRTP